MSAKQEKHIDEGKPDRVIQILKIMVWPLLILVVLGVFKDKIAPQNIEVSAKSVKISFYLLAAAERGGAANEAPKNPPDPRTIQATARKASAISLSGIKVLWARPARL
jgi:hypothetical protein